MEFATLQAAQTAMSLDGEALGNGIMKVSTSKTPIHTAGWRAQVRQLEGVSCNCYYPSHRAVPDQPSLGSCCRSSESSHLRPRRLPGCRRMCRPRCQCTVSSRRLCRCWTWQACLPWRACLPCSRTCTRGSRGRRRRCSSRDSMLAPLPLLAPLMAPPFPGLPLRPAPLLLATASTLLLAPCQAATGRGPPAPYPGPYGGPPQHLPRPYQGPPQPFYDRGPPQGPYPY